MPNNNQSTHSTPRKPGRRRSLRSEYLDARQAVLRRRQDYNSAQRAFRSATREANALEARLFRLE
jgi:hypothetical protein